MTLRHEYIYLPHSYGGHRPANRVKVEEYENGIIFGIPLFTTMHLTMMRMMHPSLTDARNAAARQGAGKRIDVEKVVRTGKLRAVKLDSDGKGIMEMAEFDTIGTVDSLSFADPRGVSATVTITDPSPEFVAILTGGTMSHVSMEHRSGCSHSRTGRCICDYIAQWDDK